ncbi:MAG TPA: hypothetical protein VFV08_11115 [Puia sp.]|nr:hypothetical protein [Puia sp.]
MKSDKRKPKFPEEPEPPKKPEIEPEVPNTGPGKTPESEISPYRDPNEPIPSEIPPTKKNDPKTI